MKFESYFGRKVALDASMHIYSFMVRQFPSNDGVARSRRARLL